MADGEFCVVCGRTGRPLVDGVCAECAADRTALVTAPLRGTVTVCPHCGAREVGGQWERAGASRVLTAEDLAPFLKVHPDAGVRRVRWEETNATATVRDYVGHADVVFRGVPRTVDVPLSVRVLSRSCPDCSRASGRYYTAVIQLRGPTERRLERSVELRARLARVWDDLVAEARPEWRRAVSFDEALPEGIDVFFKETLPARSIARLAKQRFGASLTESASLFGRKDGHDVYRVTFCLRFPRGAGAGAAPAPSSRSGASVEQ